MSNATGDQNVPSREGAEENPYGLRFRLPEQPGQLAGWVAQIDQAPTVEDLPSTEQLRDLLDGKVRPPPGRHTLWLRVGLLVALFAALFWLYFVRKSLLELITDG